MMYSCRLVIISCIVLLGLCASTGVGWAQTLTRVAETFVPYGVAVANNGDVFITENGAGRVVKLGAGTGQPVEVATGLSVPYGVAVGSTGDVYIHLKARTRMAT
ncbi:MAG: hypothetical protein FJY97_17965 [candidate division Zixibacteria bacterium]|nr:hypothetical protein [candidate division Zixibacteria bacterium]